MMKWIIQTYCDADEELIATVKSLGVDLQTVNIKDIYTTENLIAPGERVFVHSAIEAFNYLHDKYNFLHLYPKDKMNCTNYFAYWGNQCFNYEGVFLPAAEVIRRWDEFCERWDQKDLFVKPNTNDKLFVGEVFKDPSDLQHYIDYEIVPPETLLLVAPAYKIAREWRVVLKAGKVVTASLYKENGESCHKLDDRANDFAESIIPYPGLPNVYILDIAQGAHEDFWVMEPSAVNVAGFYACDLKKLVNTITEEMEFLYRNQDYVNNTGI